MDMNSTQIQVPNEPKHLHTMDDSTGEEGSELSDADLPSDLLSCSMSDVSLCRSSQKMSGGELGGNILRLEGPAVGVEYPDCVGVIVTEGEALSVEVDLECC
jgi:hypothetical protein